MEPDDIFLNKNRSLQPMQRSRANTQMISIDDNILSGNQRNKAFSGNAPPAVNPAPGIMVFNFFSFQAIIGIEHPKYYSRHK